MFNPSFSNSSKDKLRVAIHTRRYSGNKAWQQIGYAYDSALSIRNLFLSKPTMGIVLEKYKAIYFYIPKVASTTLLTSFSQIAYGRQIPIRQMPTVKENQMDKRYKDYYKFSFVRNPFDRIVSCFQDKVLKGGLDFGSDVKSFGDFASKVCLIPDQNSNMHFKSQHRFLTGGHKDALWTDYIGRFENLDYDYQFVCAYIGVKNPPSLKRRNVSVRNNYKNYYDEKTYDLIKKRYLKDLTLFGYKF